MRSHILSCILAGTALATAAAAEAGSPKSQPAAQSAALSDDKVTCRYETVTGQLAARVKRCMTGKQWRARARNARAEGEKMTNRGFSCGDEHCQ